jgi:hypothetical protein
VKKLSPSCPTLDSNAAFASVWQEERIADFEAQSIAALIANRIPAVRLANFAAPSEINSLSMALRQGMTTYNSVPQVTRLGISQYQHGVKASKAQYFRLAAKARQAQHVAFSSSFDPVSRLIQTFLAVGLDASIMEEPGWGAYFAGSGKLRNGASPIHVDFAPQDSSGWAVGQSCCQLAWNLYLDVPDLGGELIVWDKLWQPEDDIHQVDGNYFYRPAVVDRVRCLSLKANTGEILIINSRNYHAVGDTDDRLAIGSFISVSSSRQLGFWS